MPKKKKAGGKKKKASSDKKKAAAANPELLKRFSDGYTKRCAAVLGQVPLPTVAAEVSAALKGETAYETLLLDSVDLAGPEGTSRLEPLMAAIGETGYTAIRQMFFWKTIVGNIDALLLARHLETRADVVELELLDSGLSAFAMERIGAAIGFNRKLESLTVKHSPTVGDDGARNLCRGLSLNQTLTKLVLDFCNIGEAGAEALGQGIATNASWTELSLNGNRLGAPGLAHLMRGLTDNVTLKLISLQDNGIDMFEKSAMTCVRVFQLMAEVLDHNDTFTKLDLLGNVIGDDGGTAVLALYEARKTKGLPTLNIRVSHRMAKTIFDDIAKKTKWDGKAGGKKKKAAGGKKKKKKKK